MNNKIILNEVEYLVTENDLPCLVTYREKAGGSHLTITIVADLFSTGSKILFLTAFPMAKDNFLKQVGGDNTNIAMVNSVSELEASGDKQVILLESGNESLFLEAVKLLPDLSERVVLVKNIEAFSADIFHACLGFNNIILSGNLDACVAKEEIIKKSFRSIIVFNKTDIPLSIEVPELEKWSGYFLGENAQGIIKIKAD